MRDFSDEQIKILQTFYENDKIPFDDFSKYGLDRRARSFQSLLGKYIQAPWITSSNTSRAYYTLTDAGKVAYKNHLEFVKQSLIEREKLNLQRRDTIANEQTVVESKKANIIAEEANAIAKTANRKSTASIIISAISAVISIAAIIVSIILKS